MSTDRSIHLNLSTPNLGTQTGEGFAPGAGQQQNPPDAQTRQRFEQALSSAPAAAPPAESVSTPQPFALFGSMAATPAPAVPSDLPQRLDDMLGRLMVDQGSGGGKQVRMELKDDLLPGVSVVIQEAEGRLQVDFICSVEASREKLNSAVPQQAPLMAQRLQRDVLLRVQTDDLEDPCLFEVAASP